MGRSILALEGASVQLKWAAWKAVFDISHLTAHALRQGDHTQLNGGDVG